jgi:hypothetical protein
MSSYFELLHCYNKYAVYKLYITICNCGVQENLFLSSMDVFRVVSGTK